MRLSREGDCTMVGPLYRDPRPAAQLLISSAAHQSLVHDPPSRRVSLSLSLSPPFGSHIAAATWPYSSRAISKRREREGGENERVYLCSRIQAILQSEKSMKTGKTLEKKRNAEDNFSNNCYDKVK